MSKISKDHAVNAVISQIATTENGTLYAITKRGRLYELYKDHSEYINWREIPLMEVIDRAKGER